MPPIKGLHVALAEIAHGVRQGARRWRSQQQMHVIAHQDIGVDGDGALTHGIAQQVEVVAPVVIVDEDGATVDATLGDMKGDTGNLEAWPARHARSFAGRGAVASRCSLQHGVSNLPESGSVNFLRPLICATVANVPSSGPLAGQLLQGQYILEVPVQTNPVPQAVLDAANKAGVLIRDVNGTIY